MEGIPQVEPPTALEAQSGEEDTVPNTEKTLLDDFSSQQGHLTVSSLSVMLRINSNFSWQFRHLYSYIGNAFTSYNYSTSYYSIAITIRVELHLKRGL